MTDMLHIQSLGQAGYLIRDGSVCVVIDPYLSDSAAKVDPALTRLFAPPVAPEELKADIFIVTHDHLDHLDPETIEAYTHKETTAFVAPRLAAKKLASLDIPESMIHVVDHAGRRVFPHVAIEGIFALGTSPDSVDTAGYLLTFDCGKTVYHTADTSYCQLLLDCAPRADALLVCINGKWGNLNVEEAVALTLKTSPKYALPNHFDTMAPNTADPALYERFLTEGSFPGECVILAPGQIFSF